MDNEGIKWNCQDEHHRIGNVFKDKPFYVVRVIGAKLKGGKKVYKYGVSRKQPLMFKTTYLGETGLDPSVFPTKSDEEKAFISNDIQIISKHFNKVKKKMPGSTLFESFGENSDTFILVPVTNMYGAEKSFGSLKAAVEWCEKDERKNRGDTYYQFMDNVFFECYMREQKQMRRDMLLKWLGALTAPSAFFFALVVIIEWIVKLWSFIYGGD